MDDFPYYPPTPGAGPSTRLKRNYSQITIGQARGSVNRRRAVRGRARRALSEQRSLPAAHTGQPHPHQCLKLPRNIRCLKCGAFKFAYETLHFCCGNGSVVLAQNPYPSALVRLLTSQDEDAIHFRKYIRLYNNLFVFTSLGGNFEASTKKGIYVFKLHGQIYHNISGLLPNESAPKYLQLYFYDGQHESEMRTNCFTKLRRDIIDTLMKITERNPYAQFFRSLQENNINENTQILINTDTVLDQMVYNAPTSDEVAVIWSENSASSESSSPHIIVTGKDNERHQIKHYYGCYDPLQYPLLFPNGECGWIRDLPKPTPNKTALDVHLQNKIAAVVVSVDDLLTDEGVGQLETSADRHISPREYYCYKLQHRPNNLLLRAGRCLQQYIVDMYVKVENTRLDFHRNNQKAIRAELYQGILDTFEAGENYAANVGRRVILPPTFLGGPRDMKKRYLNAMSLVQKFGKPDFFVTITSNPGWPEVKELLAQGEEAQNRPDLVARVFRAKLLALKKKIMDEKFFGEVAALIYVVEFQKRGLPHAHFLIILAPASKLKGTSDFDNFVCAEIPTTEAPHLRRIVLKHMMHGPCGHLNPQCQCMQHKNSVGKCKYGYPKNFKAETTNNDEGFPMYRRRDTGETVVIRGSKLDNRWVIPYNPYLSALFDCHLNVEVCSTIQAVKYLYKYVYKGHEKVSFNVVDKSQQRAVDEINQYQSRRWVSPCEAAWRIFGFDLFEMHPPVLPLPIHLPNMQALQLRPHEHLDDIISNPVRIRTPLTEFFALNSRRGNTNILYGDVPDIYWWNKSSKKWLPRKKKHGCRGPPSICIPYGRRAFLFKITTTACS